MPFDFSRMSKMPKSVWYDEDGLPIEDVQEFIKQRREELIERARSGELSREQAEKEAADKFYGRLEVKFVSPDTSPVVAIWSPEMVAAWIVKKDLNVVLRHSEEFYKGKSLWVPFERTVPPGPGEPPFLARRQKGHDLIVFGQTSLFKPGFDFTGCPFDYSDMRWFKKLREVLIDGTTLKAHGKDIEDGRTKLIKPDEWQFVTFSQDGAGRTILSDGEGHPKFQDVTFVSREVRRCFPKHSGMIEERVNLREVRRWKVHIDKEPKGKRRFLYDLLRKEFKDGFPLTFPSEEKRLDTVEKLMGEHYQYAERDSFKRYLNGVLKEYCED